MRTHASVLQTYVRGSWMQIAIGVCVPLNCDPPNDVILQAVYARIEGNRVVEFTTVRPRCFQEETPCPVFSE